MITRNYINRNQFVTTRALSKRRVIVHVCAAFEASLQFTRVSIYMYLAQEAVYFTSKDTMTVGNGSGTVYLRELRAHTTRVGVCWNQTTTFDRNMGLCGQPNRNLAQDLCYTLELVLYQIIHGREVWRRGAW